MNAKQDQLFVYNPDQKTLLVLKLDFEADLKNTTTMSELIRNNLMISIDNFDYSPSKKYVLIQQMLYYVSLGDLV